MAEDSSKKGITPRSENYPQWYLDVIDAADLAEHSVVKGCMVIKPYGYAIWENIQRTLDEKFKETGHENAYFPLFIPKSFFSKEAEHIEGFAKECAVVTHHRLMNSPDGSGVVFDPSAKLEEELVIRPTSETIIHSTFSKWIKSWRDLPLLINQWANVVRWEMRTRLFLRTTEFLWQEGHTAHETEQEAEEETLRMLDVYKNFVQDYLGLAVLDGLKSESEKFAGALRTYTIEAMMQDRKALQAGTSHNLGQNFARAFDIRFADREGALQYVWQTSWGVSTRLIGALIMGHSDDKGLVLPPRIAPIKIVIVPIWKNDEEKAKVMRFAEEVREELASGSSPSSPTGSERGGENSPPSFTMRNERRAERGASAPESGSVKLDDRDYLTPGHKFHEWEKKGIPLRIEIGPKDIEKNQVVLVRRDNGEKQFIRRSDLGNAAKEGLSSIQKALFEKSRAFLQEHSHEIDEYDEFQRFYEGDGGFAYSHWCGSAECEAEIGADTNATIRCIPYTLRESTEGSHRKPDGNPGKCIKCGTTSDKRVVFSKAY